MPRKPSLRAVAPDETKEVPKSILDAAEAGERISELRAMRRRLAKALDDPTTAARDLSPLSRRLLEIGQEIEAIEVAEIQDHSVVETLEAETWDAQGY